MTPEYRVPNESGQFEPRIRGQRYTDCGNLTLSDGDVAVLTRIVREYDLENVDGFGDVAIREQSARDYRLFRLRAAVVNAYPCDCTAYRNITRYDGWMAYERTRDCGNTVSCGTVLPASCILGFLLASPFILVAPAALAAGQATVRTRQTAIALLGLGIPGAIFSGVLGAILFGLVGASIAGVVQNHHALVEPLSDAALVVLLLVTGGFTVTSAAMLVWLPVATVLVVLAGWTVVTGGYLAFTQQGT